jgi:hypothetical protein
MRQFRPDVKVKLRGHHLRAYRPDEKPLIVIKDNGHNVECQTEDGTPYPYPHSDLELVTPDPSRVVKPNSASRIPFGAFVGC